MRIYELRHYGLYPGVLEEMLTRFRDLNMPMFADHGIHLEHAWTDPEDRDSFYFLVSFATQQDRESAWEVYHVDRRYLEARDAQASIIKHIDITLLHPVATEKREEEGKTR